MLGAARSQGKSSLPKPRATRRSQGKRTAAAASPNGGVEDRRGLNQRRGDGGERKGHRRKRERKQGSVGGGRDGQLRPAAPALGMCHSTRRGVVSAEGRPAPEAGEPCRLPGRPGGALRGRRPGRKGSKEQTIDTLTGAARQARHSVGRPDHSQRPQRVAMAPPHERRLVECGAELRSNPRKAEPRRWSLPRFGFSR